MGRKNNYHLDTSRVIAHLDVDCFSIQVYLNKYPEFKDKPCATRGRSKSQIISISYEAKKYGITKDMTPKEAKQLCPGIKIFNKNSSSDDKASEQVFDVIHEFCSDYGITFEKTSIDDVFLDLTQICTEFIESNERFDSKVLRDLEVVVEGGNGQFRLGTQSSMRRSPLTVAAVYVDELCYEIYERTGLFVSAGISYNKLLAKISCNINKPNNVTVMATKPGIARIFENIKLECVTGLGGMLGQKVKESLRISTLRELRGFRRKRLIIQFGERGKWLWDTARGIDKTPVKDKPEFNTISCAQKCSKGMDRNRLLNALFNVCGKLSLKLVKEFEKNKRMAQIIKIEVFTGKRPKVSTIEMKSQKFGSKDIYEKVIQNEKTNIEGMQSNSITKITLTATKFTNTNQSEE